MSTKQFTTFYRNELCFQLSIEPECLWHFGTFRKRLREMGSMENFRLRHSRADVFFCFEILLEIIVFKSVCFFKLSLSLKFI